MTQEIDLDAALKEGISGHVPVPEPIREWLEANDIDLDMTPAWPVIEFPPTPYPGDATPVMRIEQFALWDNGEHPPAAPVMRWPGSKWGGTGVIMVEIPLKVPMDPMLREMWERAAPQARADLKMWQFASVMRGTLTLITPRPGQRIVFVLERGVAQTATEADFAVLLQGLRAAFPGFEVDVIGGISAVLLHEDREKTFHAPLTPMTPDQS